MGAEMVEDLGDRERKEPSVCREVPLGRLRIRTVVGCQVGHRVEIGPHPLLKLSGNNYPSPTLQKIENTFSEDLTREEISPVQKWHWL